MRAKTVPPRRFERSAPTTSSEAVSALVREGDVAVGIRYFMDRGRDLTCRQIGWEPMVVVEQRKRGARKRRETKPAEARWIGFTKSKLMRDEFGRLLASRLERAGVSAASVMIVDSLSAQKRLVEAGFGLGLLPYSSVQRELAEGTLRLVDMPEVTTEVPIALVHRRGGYLSPAATQLMTLLSAQWVAQRTPHLP